MDNHSATETSPLLSLFAALSYGIASMAMVFINKAILMHNWQLATALIIHFGLQMGYTKARGVDMQTAKRLLPVSLFYNANVAFALASLKGFNIPMYIAIKRLHHSLYLLLAYLQERENLQHRFVAPFLELVCNYTIAISLYLWNSVLKLSYHKVTLSVLLTAAGVLIAALGDFSFDLFGYSMAFTSVFFQTMYLILVERSGAEDGLSSVEIMFYNSFLSLPFLMFLIIATGEFPYSLSFLFAKSNSLSFLVILILSLVMGIVLNYTMFLCTIVNSALTTTIVGVLKGVGSTTLGFVFLGGVQVHALNVTGLVMNTAGGLWTPDLQGLLHMVYVAWLTFRAYYIAPPIQALSNFCVVLFLIQSADRMMLSLGCFWIKYKKIKPRINGDPFKSDDAEAPGYEYPKVLVQIPMCNEREAFCPDFMQAEVDKWSQKDINIIYRHRVVRTGYKAGNLKSAMGCDYVKDYEFVAIFDADFQPSPDFLNLTVPHFKDNPELGLVQARWAFVNKDENLLTRLQDINLCFHFEVEQQVNGAFLNFFGFNGTAGVWRIKALEESGGWLERTTVEDMDIAVRAHLNGWKFIFLNDVKVLCEVPESFEAYRKQQHRWHSGPMQLFRLCLPAIITSKMAIWKKVNLILLFFLLRKLILPFYSFTLFCIILPLTMFVPEAELPMWVIYYVPVLMSFLNILPAPKSFPFIVPYLLFENTMSVTKFNAMVSGLCQLGSTYEWVVTKKAGKVAKQA
ncbi:hypothetical protein GH714_008551 [Hevea brasiliensis]|uniref:glucomannan 4-beta-mannosyltransferase n=1 Tax=Hevea brasiliensis TaxID=3981 RepID=A0A6A6LQU3_HEVBR|nr:hypothetical protein GH714_008551 [Hevea brasiliensis]